MTVDVVLTVREGERVICQARATETVAEPQPSERLTWPYPEGKTCAEGSQGAEPVFHSRLLPTDEP